MIRSNLHTHSLFCDGRDTVEELCQEAFRQGLTSLGFSSHAPLSFKTGWHMKKSQLNRYADTVRSAALRWRGRLDVYLGLEIDFIENMCGPSDGRFSEYELDFVIGSVHYLVPPHGQPFTVDGPLDELTKGVAEGYRGDVVAAVDAYWWTIIAMVQAGSLDIVGHIDLIRRNNRLLRLFDEKSEHYRKSAKAAIAAIAESKGIVELNTGGMARGGLSEPYPSFSLLQAVRQASVPVTINTDTHDRRQLTAYYDEARVWLKDAGYSHQLVFQSGRWERTEL